ncbi:MAG: hypothetical protein GTO16_11080 [Candidatus Aminicenantes bacterium]|nr:hypothetical protein [Candidatus Aminicenantes bacterium]
MKKKNKERNLNLGIAEIIISLISDDNNGGFYVDDVYKGFISDGVPEVTLRAHWGGNPQYDSGKEAFDSGITWRLLQKNKKIILKTISRTAVLQSDFKAGDIHVPKEGAGKRFPFPLNYPLSEVLMINLLSKGRGAMVHGCGVDDSGDGYLFLGNSTHGKSTIAKLWSKNQATVLNDDKVIIREKDGEFWMYGTPWHGELKEVSPQGLLIQKIFFLRHGEKNSAVQKNGAEAATMLIARCFPAFWDKKGMDYTLGLCQRLVSKIPCYELKFVPNREIFNFVRNV